MILTEQHLESQVSKLLLHRRCQSCHLPPVSNAFGHTRARDLIPPPFLLERHKRSAAQNRLEHPEAAREAERAQVSRKGG